MAGHLLIFMFMNVFLEAKGQDLVAPKLNVTPSFISETDSVTLFCQNPVPVSDCFYIFGKPPAKSLPCLKSLTGHELLSMVNQRSPAEVTVTCFYLKTSESPHSDKSIITVQTLAPPTLIVQPSEITKTDSVTLHCQPPPSESQCYFYTLNGQHPVMSGCVQTLKGSELLTVNQRLPADVQIQCYYTVERGGTKHPSPHSNTRSVIVQEPKPEISLQHDDDLIFITCELPDSAEDGSKCNLYFGESPQPYQTLSRLKSSSTNRLFCQFIFSVRDFLTNLSTVQTKDISCDYTSESGHGALSPRSDGYNLRNLMNTLETNQTHVTTALLDSVMTTNTETRRTTGSETETTSSDLDSTNRPVTSSTGAAKTPLTPVPRHKTTLKDSVVKKTPLQPESGNSSSTNKPSSSLNSHKTLIWKLVILMSICGVTLGSVMLVMAFFCTKQTKRNSYVKRSQGNSTDDMDTQGLNSNGMPVTGEAYSLITSVPAAAGCSTGSVTVNRNVDVNESNPYHLYATISDEPTSVTMKNIVYSTLQMTDN